MSVNVKVFEAAKTGAVDAFTSYILGLEKTAQSRDEINSTPLHYAAANGHIDLVQIFLLNEADVNAVNDFRETPLHCAAGKGQVEVVKLLLSVKRIDLDLQTDEGWTALHLAAEKGHPEVVELLVRHGADVHIQDKGGEVAVEYAHSPKIAEVIIASASPENKEIGKHKEVPPVETICNQHISSSKLDAASVPRQSAGEGVSDELITNEPAADDAQNCGEDQFDTIDIEIEVKEEDQSGKTIESGTTATTSTNQCCVVM